MARVLPQNIRRVADPKRTRAWIQWIETRRWRSNSTPWSEVMITWLAGNGFLCQAIEDDTRISNAQHHQRGHREEQDVEISGERACVEVLQWRNLQGRCHPGPIDRDRSPPKLRVPRPPQIVRGARPNPLLGRGDRFICIRGRIWRHLIRIPVRDGCSKIRTLLESPIWIRGEKFVAHSQPPQATTAPSPPDIWSMQCARVASHG